MRCLALALALSLVACGGGPPRKPMSPEEREAAKRDGIVRRERFKVLGVGDEWHDGLTMIDGLKRQGGVEDCLRDATDGEFVVVFNSERTSRDAIVEKIKEIGRDEGASWEPIFDDR